MCIGLISALLHLGRSEHSLTLLYALETSIKLSQDSDVLSMPRALLFVTSVTTLTTLSGVPLAHMLPLRGPPDKELAVILTCKLNIPSEHPIPEKTSLNPLCILYVNTLLALLSAVLFVLDLK